MDTQTDGQIDAQTERQMDTQTDGRQEVRKLKRYVNICASKT